jgi:protein tyrosine/serine phosphatase
MRGKRLALVGLSLLASLSLLGWLYYLLVGGNFYVVDPEVLFRSAQPDAQRLERYAGEHHLRTVLNLRGGHPDAGWYVEELGATERLGMVHLDLRFSATEEATLEQMDELVQTMRSAPKPLLVHCMAGADRTGLAVALYRYAIQHQPPEQAQAGLSPLQGHLPYLGSRTGAMDRSFARYVASRTAGAEPRTP